VHSSMKELRATASGHQPMLRFSRVDGDYWLC